MSVHFKEHVSVFGGALKRDPWKITDFHVIDGMKFIPICKRDSGFNRFVTGDHKGLKDYTWITNFRNARNTHGLASDSAIVDASPADLSRWHKNKRREQHKVGASDEYVELTMPAVTYGDTEIEGVTIKVKAEDSDLKGVYVEMDAAVLNYIRFAILAEVKESPKKRKDPSIAGEKYLCRWKENRNGFEAKRVRHDGDCKKVEYMLFKALDTTTEEVETAKAAAIAWCTQGHAASAMCTYIHAYIHIDQKRRYSAPHTHVIVYMCAYKVMAM